MQDFETRARIERLRNELGSYKQRGEYCASCGNEFIDNAPKLYAPKYNGNICQNCFSRDAGEIIEKIPVVSPHD